MTSQLNVDTIVDKAGSGGSNVKMANTSTYTSGGGNVTQNTVQSLAKAFHGFGDQAAGALNANSKTLNISSYEDTGTGRSRLNMINAMSVATGYMVVGSTQIYSYGIYAVTASQYEVGAVNAGGSYSDGVTHALVMGDLA